VPHELALERQCGATDRVARRRARGGAQRVAGRALKPLVVGVAAIVGPCGSPHDLDGLDGLAARQQLSEEGVRCIPHTSTSISPA
jgi:hypothetical protein